MVREGDKAVSLTLQEQQVIAAIQGDIPVTARPYADIAARLDMTQEHLLAILRDLVARGIIRRFGATLRHQKSGFEANVMVAWQVDATRIDQVGETMATFRAVSHCYRRDPTNEWPYNLYTMVHGRDEAACRSMTAEMAAKTGVVRYEMLFSRRELKKTSMQYFKAGA
ncbi:MAG: Lrp/AsnC family transcriptional regulator [Desulfatitalea sp.]|nr:Lrp/AsnC family transcriptional regulator [Desulfatitalea sp.]NNK00125.1 Lrp/AsnC family transcriptional regulator [Desulfatitalea sp.]